MLIKVFFFLILFGGQVAFSQGALNQNILTEPYQQIQKTFFEKSFPYFAETMKQSNPKIKFGGVNLNSPAPYQSLPRESWTQAFSDELGKRLKVPDSELVELKKIAEDRMTSYYHNVGFARYHYLQAMPSLTPIQRNQKFVPIRIETVSTRDQFREDLPIDVKKYVDERIPHELQEFFKQRKTELYVHDVPCDDARKFYSDEGFHLAVRYMGPRDNEEGPYMLVEDQAKNRSRFLVCDLFGEDGRTRALELIGPLMSIRKAKIVYSRTTKSPFQFNEAGANLQLKPVGDLVLMGFQNTIWWELHERPEWSRVNLSDRGIDIFMLVNEKTGQRIISVANVYGDEIRSVLEELYRKGARGFLYLGTAGGLSENLSIGDVVLPQQVINQEGKIIPFNNSVLHGNVDVSPNQVVKGSSHGWVSTLMIESFDYLRGLKAKGAASLDIEMFHYADFFQSHPDATAGMILAISDLPFGGHTYDKEGGESRQLPMRSIKKNLPRFITKLEDSKKRKTASDAGEMPTSSLGADLFQDRRK